jgi:pyruvate formate lyase activating enzyme
MRCPFCHNPDLVLPENIAKSHLLDEGELLEHLKKRRKYLDGLVITGGEPTIQSDIVYFCRKIKTMGYDIKLDTNGLMPEIVEKLLVENLVDYIAMDIKGALDEYPKFCGIKIDGDKICRSIKIIKGCGLKYEFRSTLVKGLHNKESVLKMSQSIKGAKLYYLQNFNLQDRLVAGDFTGQGFTVKEMENFAKIAKELVKECKIR